MSSHISLRLALAFPLLLAAACSTGDTTDRPASSGNGNATPARYALETGTSIDAALTSTIRSLTATVGDAFTARVVTDVVNVAGTVAIPAGSMVHGVVTNVSAAAASGTTGTITIVVSRITVRGETYDVRASIDSLETMHEGQGLETMDVVRVVGGAAFGAVAGRVIGGNATGTVIGGVIGGAIGAAASLAMKDVDVVLPEGSRLMLSLRERLLLSVN
ncbi:MAG: hypothetical protein WD934_08940 [Gemmatimonadales bacterium]